MHTCTNTVCYMVKVTFQHVICVDMVYMYIDFALLQEYKNATRTEFGVWSLPRGKDYYRACLKWHLSTDITPEEVHSLGLREVARISGLMQQVCIPYRVLFNYLWQLFLKTPLCITIDVLWFKCWFYYFSLSFM